MAEESREKEQVVEESVAEEPTEAMPKEDPPHHQMDDIPPEAPSTATSGHPNPNREQAGMNFGPSKTMPTHESPFTRTSFHDISDTSSSSESTSDDDEFETPFSKMSFKEF